MFSHSSGAARRNTHEGVVSGGTGPGTLGINPSSGAARKNTHEGGVSGGSGPGTPDVPPSSGAARRNTHEGGVTGGTEHTLLACASSGGSRNLQ